MLRINIKLKYRSSGNWIINCVLLCSLNISGTLSCSSNGTLPLLPKSWPCNWSSGVIPFVYDFFSMSPKRLISLVSKGLSYLEKRSCLKFEEHNPVESARKDNFTYLFFTYSEVLENCCTPFFTNPVGRRIVLVTPLCSLDFEVGHATLHALGLTHYKKELFPEANVFAVLFVKDCPQKEKKTSILFRDRFL